MAKKGKAQLSLNLPKPKKRVFEPPSDQPIIEDKIGAPVYSFTERKKVKDREEMAKHFLDIIRLVSHFK